VASLSSNKSPPVKEKPPLKNSQSPKEEREMLKQFAESIPDAPEPIAHLGTTEVPEFEKSKFGHVPTIKSSIKDLQIVEKPSSSGIIPDFLEEIPPEENGLKFFP
jgi:hypothetical protein